MPVPATLLTMTAGATARAAHVNSNFAELATAAVSYALYTDVARTITAVLTFTTAPVFSAGFGVAGTLTVSTGGITITGNSTITGTLGGVTTFTVTTVAATTFSGAPNFSGTPTFGAGFTVTAGTVSFAALTITGTLTLGGTTQKIIGPSSSISFRNNADSATWLSYIDGSTLTIGNATLDVVLGGASAAAATAGFPRLPILAATPTGAATVGSFCAVEGDNKIYVRIGGAWKGVTVA